MKKMLMAVMAFALVFSLSTSLMAEVQNVRLGGDIRARMYYTKNLYDVGNDTDDDDFYFMQRSRISAEADLTDNVWAVATVEADGNWGYKGVSFASQTGQSSTNEWDVNIAEAYVQLSEIFYSPLTLKLGRQYLQYGRGFLISSREWENKFDAARMIMDLYPWTIDLVYSRLVESDRVITGGSPKPADDEDLFGLNLNYQEDLWTMEGYIFGIRDEWEADDPAVPGELTKNAPIALGIRGDASPFESLDLWGEFCYELGKYQLDSMTDSENIRAFAFDAGMVYVFDVTWEPAVALSYTFASGDDGSDATNPLEGFFNPFFNYNYYGYAYSPYLSNIGIFNAQLSVLPSEDTTLVLDFYYYNQAKDVAMSMGDPNQDNGGVMAMTDGQDKDLGMELDVILEYDYTEDVSTQFVAAWFKPGDAYETDTFDPDDVFEARAEVIVSF